MSKLLEQINNSNKTIGTLSSFIDLIGGGTPKTTVKEYWNGDIPWLSVVDFNNGSRWVSDAEKKITNAGLENSSTRLLEKDDIIISARGTVGVLSQLARPMAFNQSCYGIRAKEGVDQNYLFYLLKASIPKLSQIVHGAVFDTITKDSFEQISVPIPDLPTQKKIASILSVYDEKIENNNKIIKNLEQMAQTIFNEWFVNFKFPGYEKVKMVDSEIGEIPEDWTVKDIKDIFTVILGGTPSREKPEYWNGSIPWINSGEVNKLRILEATENITELGLNKSNARLIKSGATVLAITGATLGQVSRLEIDSTANQSVVGIFDEKDILNEYLYLYITNNILDLISGASGGAQQHINKQMVENYQILIPTDTVIKNFNEKIKSTFILIKELFNENISLKSQRDLLLVKLI